MRKRDAAHWAKALAQFPSTLPTTPHERTKADSVQYCHPVLHHELRKQQREETFQLGPRLHSRLLGRNVLARGSRDAFLFHEDRFLYVLLNVEFSIFRVV